MKRPLFDVGMSVLIASAVVLYGNTYSYLLLPLLLAGSLFCAVKSTDRRWRRAAVCMLSGAAAILFILAAGLRLESRFRPLDGQTAEAVGVVTEKRHGQLYEAYGTVRTANGEARRIKFTLWNAVADELEAGDSFRCTVPTEARYSLVWGSLYVTRTVHRNESPASSSSATAFQSGNLILRASPLAVRTVPYASYS